MMEPATAHYTVFEIETRDETQEDQGEEPEEQQEQGQVDQGEEPEEQQDLEEQGQGYCDVFLKCRAVDADGPLVRLMNLLLNRETLLTVAQWITEYWWAVMLMGIAFIIFMGLFIKCCAVHTPSSNPKKPPARRISETLRRPMNTLRRMRYQHGTSHHASPHGPTGRSRQDRPSRPSVSQSGPRPGCGEGRGHYHAPKDYSLLATAPPVSNSRQNRPEPYAEAYEMRNKV
ncbi:hypothetical protein NQ317_000161 [Molorchus minor]|uniref:Uncharacterized protein n=1 Tax=Molorchus minor TaxID=1323400 RepID=A0ABQ9JIK0_9CUCU|nr:hypothetical protein NQ317_000161 [Molorchus minor]